MGQNNRTISFRTKFSWRFFFCPIRCTPRSSKKKWFTSRTYTLLKFDFFFYNFRLVKKCRVLSKGLDVGDDKVHIFYIGIGCFCFNNSLHNIFFYHEIALVRNIPGYITNLAKIKLIHFWKAFLSEFQSILMIWRLKTWESPKITKKNLKWKKRSGWYIVLIVQDVVL